MLRCEIPVKSDADRLLYEGLPLLIPVLDELGEGALLIGGLATMAWLSPRPVGLPIRATRDVDLGMDRAVLGLRGDRAIIAKLLREHDFKPGYAEEAFRFARETPAGMFVVDLLIAPGASRAQPPILEPGIPSLAAPGLAYALLRGPMPLELNLIGEEHRSFALHTVNLDAAFVLKAALVASGLRQREDRRITDTVDAVMLAAACAGDVDAMTELGARRKRSDVRAAVRWMSEQFASPLSATARRVTAHVGSEEGGEWAFTVARRFVQKLARGTE
jgi:hypothetical protein